MCMIREQVDVNILDASTTVMDLSGYVSGAVFYDGSTEEVTSQSMQTRHS